MQLPPLLSAKKGDRSKQVASVQTTKHLQVDPSTQHADEMDEGEIVLTQQPSHESRAQTSCSASASRRARVTLHVPSGTWFQL
jgi:hypothetical protein